LKFNADNIKYYDLIYQASGHFWNECGDDFIWLYSFIAFLVVGSGQSIWNVIFFRCLFGAIGLVLYCQCRDFFSPWPLKLKDIRLVLLASSIDFGENISLNAMT